MNEVFRIFDKFDELRFHREILGNIKIKIFTVVCESFVCQIFDF